MISVLVFSGVEKQIAKLGNSKRVFMNISKKGEEHKVLTHTTSGGVTVNDVIMHVMQEDLPFGGVGPSGMGSYHGHDGFKTFSHAKAIYSQSKLVSKLAAAMRPPYKKSSAN